MGKLATAFVFFVFAGALSDNLLLIIVNPNQEQVFAVTSFQVVCWTFAVIFGLLFIAKSIQYDSTDKEPRNYKGINR